ncbi:MAG: hypothetical protein J5552_02175 [Prevotella sp.]|nr:hypothetical protein [Prevotella sp.]
MKKTYIIPQTKLHTVKLQGMIAASAGLTFGNGQGTGTLQDENASGDAMSRKGGFWDDEDDWW